MDPVAKPVLRVFETKGLGHDFVAMTTHSLIPKPEIQIVKSCTVVIVTHFVSESDKHGVSVLVPNKALERVDFCRSPLSSGD